MALNDLIQNWRRRLWGALTGDKVALGIEPVALQGRFLIWVAYPGEPLVWLSSHTSRQAAEAALPRVRAWIARREQSDPLMDAVEMTLLCEAGDGRVIPPSERLQAEIQRRIEAREPGILFVARASHPDAHEIGEESPDEWTMQVLRATNRVRVWQQLQALDQEKRRPRGRITTSLIRTIRTLFKW